MKCPALCTSIAIKLTCHHVSFTSHIIAGYYPLGLLAPGVKDDVKDDNKYGIKDDVKGANDLG